MTFNTNDDIRRRVEESGYECASIGEVLNGLAIYCVRLGGQKQPPILVTAGSHAAEPGGVAGALNLIAELKTDHTLYVVPNRDPMGLEGYHRYLSFALGRDVAFNDNRELAALLRERGQVLYDDNELVLSIVNGIGFTAMDPSPALRGQREVWLKVTRLLCEDRDFRVRLAGKRVVTPNNLPNSDGCGLFERAYTCIVTDEGRLTHLNCLFGSATAPPEVRHVQAFVDQIKPGLTIDMHEGHAKSFYLLVPLLKGNRLLEAVGRGIVRGVIEKGYKLYTLEELRERIGEEEASRIRDLGDGMMEEDLSEFEPDSLMAYIPARYGLYCMQETGRMSSLEQRGLFHLWGALGGIRAFEKHFM